MLKQQDVCSNQTIAAADTFPQYTFTHAHLLLQIKSLKISFKFKV